MVHRSDLFIFGKKRPNGNYKRESEIKRQIGREVDVEKERERGRKRLRPKREGFLVLSGFAISFYGVL